MNDRPYRINKITRPTPDSMVLDLYDPKRPVFDFKPGQYVMISYRNHRGHTDKHAFSIANAPGTDDLRLGIKIGGPFTQGLAQMEEGDEILVSGPFGKFVFDHRQHNDLVLIAGGIGITPFLSTLAHAVHHRLPNKLSLLYSNKTIAGTYFLDDIKKLEQQNPNFRALFCITQEQLPPHSDNLHAGRITEDVVKKFIGDTAGKTFFICGPTNFMAGAKTTLLNIGVTEKQIAMEEFTMIQDKGFWPSMKYVSYAVGLATILMMLPLSLIYGHASATVTPGSGSIFSTASPYGSANIYKIGTQLYNQASSATQNSTPTVTNVNLTNQSPAVAPTTPISTPSTHSASSEQTRPNNFDDD